MKELKALAKPPFARMLAESLGGITIKTPPDELEDQRAWFMNTNPSPQETYEYFRGLVTSSSALIRRHLAAGVPVVSDRYWYSTMAVNMAAGATTSVQDFKGLLIPDRLIYLKANLAVCSKRLQNRDTPKFAGKAIGDAWDAEHMSGEKLEASFHYTFGEVFDADMLPDMLTIDTSDLTPIDVASKALYGSG